MLCIWLYGWGMSQKLPVNDFKWVEDLPDFDEVFTKNYNEKCKKIYFFEVYIQYPKESHELRNDLPFLPEKITKMNMLFT